MTGDREHRRLCRDRKKLPGYDRRAERAMQERMGVDPHTAGHDCVQRKGTDWKRYWANLDEYYASKDKKKKEAGDGKGQEEKEVPGEPRPA